jgi:hypothetical protein
MNPNNRPSRHAGGPEDLSQKPGDRSSERGKKAELEFLSQNEQQTREGVLASD